MKHEVAVRQLIHERYALVHGAISTSHYPHFCVVDAAGESGPQAALGFRMANAERLFLEDYLDDPVERVVSDLFQIPVSRDRIVEIGAHASLQSRATVALWARAARHLDKRADVAVAVLTFPLRRMFDRLGIPFEQICDADPARVPGGGDGWGSYYEHEPRVCAGLIAPAIPKLAPFTRLDGHCQ